MVTYLMRHIPASPLNTRPLDTFFLISSLAHLAYSCCIFTSPFMFVNAHCLPLLATTHMPPHVTMLIKDNYLLKEHISTTLNIGTLSFFNKSSITKSAIANIYTYIYVCMHITIWEMNYLLCKLIHYRIS